MLPLIDPTRNVFYDQAQYYSAGRGYPINVIGLHTVEAPLQARVSEAVARYYSGSDGPTDVASPHYTCDPVEISQSVHELDTAYAMPPLNGVGIHVEHAGYAHFARTDWLTPAGLSMLEISARLFGWLCHKYNVPAVVLSEADLRAGTPSTVRGIVPHVAASNVWHQSTHWDPGPNWPYDIWLPKVQTYAAGYGHPTPAPTPAPPAPIGGLEMVLLQVIETTVGYAVVNGIPIALPYGDINTPGTWAAYTAQGVPRYRVPQAQFAKWFPAVK